VGESQSKALWVDELRKGLGKSSQNQKKGCGYRASYRKCLLVTAKTCVEQGGGSKNGGGRINRCCAIRAIFGGQASSGGEKEPRRGQVGN